MPSLPIGPTAAGYTNATGDTTITPTSQLFTANVTFTGSARTSNLIVDPTGMDSGGRITISCVVSAAADSLIVVVKNINGSQLFSYTKAGEANAIFSMEANGNGGLIPLQSAAPAYGGSSAAALTSTYVGYGSASNTLTGSSGLAFNSGNNALTVGGAINAGSASISGGGSILLTNGSGSGVRLYPTNTNGQAQLVDQNASTGVTLDVGTAETLIVKNKAGNGSGALSAGSVRGTAVTFSNLPASPVEGMLVGVTDSNTATWGATIAGSGSNHVLAYYNGTNWTVAGK
jgi:hypothetical protein